MKAFGHELAVGSWRGVKVGAALILVIGLSACYSYPDVYYGDRYGYEEGYYRPNGPAAYHPYRPYYDYP